MAPNLNLKRQSESLSNLMQSKLVFLLSLRMLVKRNGAYSLPKFQCETLTKKTRKNWSELSQRLAVPESSCASSLKRSKYYLPENLRTTSRAASLLGAIKSSLTSTTTSNGSFSRSKDLVSTVVATQSLWRISPTPVLTLAALLCEARTQGLGIFRKYEPNSSVLLILSLKRLMPALLFSSLLPNNRWSTLCAAKRFPT